MDIRAQITGISYQPLFGKELIHIPMNEFNINNASPASIIDGQNGSFAISKWVTPKRTRSYPYSRVYDTLGISKKITVIPIIKDEGAGGDRDFIQWDTVSLMSLLDVFVILAYYETAEINPRNNNKITNQQFSNEFVMQKIREIESYHSSALHWNLQQLKEDFFTILNLSIHSYQSIGERLNMKMHNMKGIETFKRKIGNSIDRFMLFSRYKAEQAQKREINTIQPKESLFSLTKAKITITNYLGGEYFFTTDELALRGEVIELIECKHTASGIIPSMDDIKDGLLKMILYSNFSKVNVNDYAKNSKAVLLLTSTKINGFIVSSDEQSDIKDFCQENGLSFTEIDKLFSEAKINNFVIKISQI